MTENRIIKPRLDVDLDEADPIAIMIGMHHRVVAMEKNMIGIKQLVESLRIEVEMVSGEIEKINQRHEKIDKAWADDQPRHEKWSKEMDKKQDDIEDILSKLGRKSWS